MYVDGCLTRWVSFNKFCICFTLSQGSVCLAVQGGKHHQPLPEKIWIVYVMKDILYRLQYHFSWSRRYDAYALGKRDELVRCAFLMAHLLFKEVGGVARRPPQIWFWSSEFDRHGSVCEGWDKAVQLWSRLRGEEWEAPLGWILLVWLLGCLTSRLAVDEYCMVLCSRGWWLARVGVGPLALLPVAVSCWLFSYSSLSFIETTSTGFQLIFFKHRLHAEAVLLVWLPPSTSGWKDSGVSQTPKQFWLLKQTICDRCFVVAYIYFYCEQKIILNCCLDVGHCVKSEIRVFRLSLVWRCPLSSSQLLPPSLSLSTGDGTSRRRWPFCGSHWQYWAVTSHPLLSAACLPHITLSLLLPVFSIPSSALHVSCQLCLAMVSLLGSPYHTSYDELSVCSLGLQLFSPLSFNLSAMSSPWCWCVTFIPSTHCPSQMSHNASCDCVLFQNPKWL